MLENPTPTAADAAPAIKRYAPPNQRYLHNPKFRSRFLNFLLSYLKLCLKIAEIVLSDAVNLEVSFFIGLFSSGDL